MELSNMLLKKYEKLNTVSKSGNAVLFGSTFASTLPVNELLQDYGINQIVYNRSIKGLSVFNAKDCLKTCVIDLKPSKVFISLGEEDLDMDISEVISQYEWLLYQLHSHLKDCRIYLISVCRKDKNITALNNAIKTLASESGCKYISISDAALDAAPEFRGFSIIKTYLRERPINFSDAMMLQSL